MADVRTLGNMIDRIMSELMRDDLGTSGAPLAVTDSSIYNAIQDAIADYQRESFFINENVDSSQLTTTGVNLYDFPTDLFAPIQTDIIGNNIVMPLLPLEYQIMDAWDAVVPLPVQGFPVYVATMKNQVRLYPTPNTDTYKIRFIYQQILTAPTLIADTNFWTTSAESLIRNRAKYNLNVTVIRDTEAALMDSKAEKDALMRLLRESNAKLFTGTLRSTKF